MPEGITTNVAGKKIVAKWSESWKKIKTGCHVSWALGWFWCNENVYNLTKFYFLAQVFTLKKSLLYMRNVLSVIVFFFVLNTPCLVLLVQ